MFSCFLSLFVRVEVSNAYANVLSIIVFFSYLPENIPMYNLHVHFLQILTFFV
jgi:hypothetical protein